MKIKHLIQLLKQPCFISVQGCIMMKANCDLHTEGRTDRDKYFGKFFKYI